MKKECCVNCRESLADNFCCAPTCKCHITEQPCNHKEYTPNGAIGKDFCPKCGASGYFHDSSPVEAVEGWEVKYERGWRMDFPSGDSRLKYPTQFYRIKDFIRIVVQEAEERGYTEGKATCIKDFCDKEEGIKIGRSDALNAVEEMIKELADEVRLYSPSVKPIFAKVVFVKRLITELQSLLDSGEKHD